MLMDGSALEGRPAARSVDDERYEQQSLVAAAAASHPQKSGFLHFSRSAGTHRCKAAMSTLGSAAGEPPEAEAGAAGSGRWRLPRAHCAASCGLQPSSIGWLLTAALA